jgi:hypothetical protein
MAGPKQTVAQTDVLEAHGLEAGEVFVISTRAAGRPAGPRSTRRWPARVQASRAASSLPSSRNQFADAVAGLGAVVLRPPRATEPQTSIHLAPLRQRIESVFSTCKDLLSLERHGARTPDNLFARVAIRLLALAACISLNHKLGRPSRAIAAYTA